MFFVLLCASRSKRRQLKKTRSIVKRYVKDHPDVMDGVMKAYYAYHAPHFRLVFSGHNFLGCFRTSKCAWCGRSREMVRHDNLPAQCLHRPISADRPIVDVVLEEEQKSYVLLERAGKDVPKLIAKMGMSGETLAVLHHTHGYDPDMVALALDMLHSESTVNIHSLMPEYELAMNRERARSKAVHRETVVIAQI